MTLDKALHDHLDALNLPKAEKARIKAAQNELNTLLRASFDPQGQVRLGGSVSRGTAIRPLKDVDLLLVLSDRKVPALLSQNPATLMKRLEAELAAVVKVPVRTQNRSLSLVWQGIPFDLVPCAMDGAPDVLRLPDLGRSRWLRTSPDQHAKLSQEADQKAGQMLLPIVRGVKAWRRHIALGLTSFHVEAMLWRCLDARPHGLADGLALAFNRLSERVQGGLPDPTGLGARVDESVSDADRTRARELFRQAAQQALRLSEASDPAGAVARLLGPRPA